MRKTKGPVSAFCSDWFYVLSLCLQYLVKGLAIDASACLPTKQNPSSSQRCWNLRGVKRWGQWEGSIVLMSESQVLALPPGCCVTSKKSPTCSVGIAKNKTKQQEKPLQCKELQHCEGPAHRFFAFNPHGDFIYKGSNIMESNPGLPDPRALFYDCLYLTQ